MAKDHITSDFAVYIFWLLPKLWLPVKGKVKRLLSLDEITFKEKMAKQEMAFLRQTVWKSRTYTLIRIPVLKGIKVPLSLVGYFFNSY